MASQRSLFLLLDGRSTHYDEGIQKVLKKKEMSRSRNSPRINKKQNRTPVIDESFTSDAFSSDAFSSDAFSSDTFTSDDSRIHIRSRRRRKRRQRQRSRRDRDRNYGRDVIRQQRGEKESRYCDSDDISDSGKSSSESSSDDYLYSNRYDQDYDDSYERYRAIYKNKSEKETSTNCLNCFDFLCILHSDDDDSINGDQDGDERRSEKTKKTRNKRSKANLSSSSTLEEGVRCASPPYSCHPTQQSQSLQHRVEGAEFSDSSSCGGTIVLLKKHQKQKQAAEESKRGRIPIFRRGSFSNSSQKIREKRDKYVKQAKAKISKLREKVSASPTPPLPRGPQSDLPYIVRANRGEDSCDESLISSRSRGSTRSNRSSSKFSVASFGRRTPKVQKKEFRPLY